MVKGMQLRGFATWLAALLLTVDKIPLRPGVSYPMVSFRRTCSRLDHPVGTVILSLAPNRLANTIGSTVVICLHNMLRHLEAVYRILRPCQIFLRGSRNLLW